MNRFPAIWACALSLLWQTAFATSDTEPAEEPGQGKDMVWPGPPQPARIRFEKSFSKAEDLGHHLNMSARMKKIIAGSDERRMERPYSIAVNDRIVVVADPSSAVVHLFEKNKKTYRQLLKLGQYDLASPIGVALGGDRVYIADSELNLVFIMNYRFKMVAAIEGFQRPTGLAFDEDRKRLYVTDTLAHEIHVFSHAGKRLFKFGGNGEKHGQFNYPSHIAYRTDRLFVNDTLNFRIQIFDSEGRFISAFGDHGTGPGYMAQPKGLAIGPEGNVYVADAVENHVQIFDRQGLFLLSFGHQGNDAGGFRMPAGLAAWKDEIYVADSLNGRVQVFKHLKVEP